MYYCQAPGCRTLVAAGKSTFRIVTKKREKTYRNVITHGKKIVDTKESQGWEIAEELVVCAQCHTRLQDRVT